MILVTGATGFVGSLLLLALLQKGEKVRALYRKSSQTRSLIKTFSYYTTEAEELFDRIEWREGDMLDEMSLREALQGIDHVYHTAAVVTFNPWKRKTQLRTNIDGTATLVNLCLEQGIGKFCFVSSVSAVGNTPDGSVANEDSIWKDRKGSTGYSISKFKSEMEVWRGIAEGLNAVIINPYVILGPGNWKHGSPQFFSQGWKGLRFYKDGLAGYVDIRDVVNIMIRLMESSISGERFILFSEEMSFLEFFSLVACALGKEPPRWRVPVPLMKIAGRMEEFLGLVTNTNPRFTSEMAAIGLHQPRYSNEKIRQALEYSFIPVKQSVEEITKWFLADHEKH
jgi:dihydroflavonol-4-reductase